MYTPKSYVLLWIVVAALFSGVALAEDPAKPTEARLLERANAYWSALQAGDFATMYGLEAGARNGTLSPDKLRNSVGRSRLLKYAFKEVKIEDKTMRRLWLSVPLVWQASVGRYPLPSPTAGCLLKVIGITHKAYVCVRKQGMTPSRMDPPRAEARPRHQRLCLILTSLSATIMGGR
jgi:hypothetical protein